MANNQGQWATNMPPALAVLWLAACAVPDSTEGAANPEAPVAAEISPVAAEPANDIRTMVATEAMHQGSVPPALALAVAKVGSNIARSALDATGAVGTMQISPGLADEFDLHPDDLRGAASNIRAGVACLAALQERYAGDWRLTLSHYRGGPLTEADGAFVPHAFTRRYVREVLRQWQLYRHDPLAAAWLRKVQGLPRFVASGTSGGRLAPVAIAAVKRAPGHAEAGGRWRPVVAGRRFK